MSNENIISLHLLRKLNGLKFYLQMKLCSGIKKSSSNWEFRLVWVWSQSSKSTVSMEDKMTQWWSPFRPRGRMVVGRGILPTRLRWLKQWAQKRHLDVSHYAYQCHSPVHKQVIGLKVNRWKSPGCILTFQSYLRHDFSPSWSLKA